MEITPMKELDWADLRIDTYRKSGGGGWLNKPDTCVRITHVPSGIAIEEEDDRSPHRNRAEAMRKIKLAFDLNPEMFAPEPRRQPAVPLHAAALKELAELVTDAHRYRKIKAMLEAGVSASIESRQENLYYDVIPLGEQMRYCVYPNTPVGSEVTTAPDLDTLVDSLPPPYPPK